MKRNIPIVLALISILLFSCTNDIETNTPALQASTDGVLFRTSIRKAILNDDGTLVISGNSDSESISFTTGSTSLGKHKMDNTTSKMNFQASGENYKNDGFSDGEVIITDISNNTVSGTFFLRDLKDDNGRKKSFHQGWFYKIPLENAQDIVEEETTSEINPCLLDASLTAMIDGQEMITDDHNATVFGVQDVSILITARTQENEEITIVFPITATPGSYALIGSGAYSATYSIDNDKASAVDGTLNIDFHNLETRCISGTFEFATGTGIEVTQGTFEYGY